MNCPKCHTRLREVQGMSGASQLQRQDAVCSTETVVGWSCWCCGYWKYVEPVPFMTVVPRTADEPRLAWDPVEKTKTHFIVVKFYDSIVRQKKAGVSWHTVAQMLTQAGARCQEKTLQKHFLLEQGKRCGDEQAQKQKTAAL